MCVLLISKSDTGQLEGELTCNLTLPKLGNGHEWPQTKQVKAQSIEEVIFMWKD